MEPIFNALNQQAVKKSRDSSNLVRQKSTFSSMASKKQKINYAEGIKAISSKIKQIKINSARNSQPSIPEHKLSHNILKTEVESKELVTRPKTGKHSSVSQVKFTEDEIKFLSDTLQKEIQSKRCKSTKR